MPLTDSTTGEREEIAKVFDELPWIVWQREYESYMSGHPQKWTEAQARRNADNSEGVANMARRKAIALEKADKALAIIASREPAPSRMAASSEGGQANHDCLAKRRPGEPMFILLGRDPDAHNIVRLWAKRRLVAGGDAEHCAQGVTTASRMEVYSADPANAPASAPGAENYPPIPMLAAHPESGRDLEQDAVGTAEREVGRYVYMRVEALMSSDDGTAGARELDYLAQIVSDVEEYGADRMEPSDLQPMPHFEAPTPPVAAPVSEERIAEARRYLKYGHAESDTNIEMALTAALAVPDKGVQGDQGAKAREFIENWFAPWGSWKTAWWEMAVSDDVEMSDANALRAVLKILTPSDGAAS